MKSWREAATLRPMPGFAEGFGGASSTPPDDVEEEEDAYDDLRKSGRALLGEGLTWGRSVDGRAEGIVVDRGVLL